MSLPAPLTWDVGLALLALELLETDRLVDLATVGLENRIDSEPLTRLAGMAKDSDQLRPLFDRAIQELGVRLPDPHTAAICVARAIASQIVLGQLDVFEGARSIAAVSRAAGPGFHDLDTFIYAESEAEDRPADREFFSNAIREKARELVTALQR